MKIILSRKGFDSVAGGIVSPIFEDGSMVSLPIPSDDDNSYNDFIYKDIDYVKILTDLKYRGEMHCHADPDLDQSRRKKKIHGWVPAFGQAGSSSTYLKNIGVGVGDIFLFFGNFHFVTNNHDRIKYIKNTGDFYKDNDLQVIWGYLQVGEILDTKKDQKKLRWHPHSNESRTCSDTNVIFKAAERLSFDPDKPGAGLLSFDEKRVLTRFNCSKANWKWNSLYAPNNIYGNRKNSANDPLTGIYYSGIWQELGLKESEECTQWAKDMISDDKAIGNVLLTAECHNWGLQNVMDWHESQYILHKNGVLTIIDFVGEEITERQSKLSEKDMLFIRNHIEKYVECTSSSACDGEAWRVRYGNKEFETGYVYGTDLEKITKILDNTED